MFSLPYYPKYQMWPWNIMEFIPHQSGPKNFGNPASSKMMEMFRCKLVDCRRVDESFKSIQIHEIWLKFWDVGTNGGDYIQSNGILW